MRTILAFLAAMVALSSCGLKGTTEEMLEQVKLSNSGLKKSNDEIAESNKKQDELLSSVHRQTLAAAYQALTSPINTDSLNPPVLMMPPAKIFADSATSDELLQAFYTLVTDALTGFDAQRLPGGGGWDVTTLRARARQVSMTAAQAIAAFASQEKVEQILHAQIEVGGRYQDTAYIFAACRFSFVHDFLFKAKLDNTTTMSVDFLREMAERFSWLQYLGNLAYRDKLKVNVPKILISKDKDGHTLVQDVTLAVDADNTLKMDGKNAAFTIESGMSATQKKDLEVVKLLAVLRGESGS